MITWSDPKYINNKLFKTFILLFVFPNTTFFFLHWGCASQILPVATEILSLGQIKENTFYKFYGIMKLWNSTSTKFKGTGSRRCLDMDWRSETCWQGVAVVSTVTSQEIQTWPFCVEFVSLDNSRIPRFSDFFPQYKNTIKWLNWTLIIKKCNIKMSSSFINSNRMINTLVHHLLLLLNKL